MNRSTLSMSALNRLRQLAVAGLLPEVADRRATPVSFRHKAVNTAVAVLVYLAGSRLPLYGIDHTTEAPDPFYWSHMAGASNRDTLMALGVYPLLVSELVMHHLCGPKISMVPKEQRMQRIEGFLAKTGSYKLNLALVLAMVSAICDVLFFEGQLGGAVNATLIALQLFAGGAIVVYLDQALKMGHGLVSSGIALFTATNICAGFLWELAYGGVHVGDKVPAIVAVASTCAFLALVVRLQGLRLPLAVKTRRDDGVEPMLQANCSLNLSFLSYPPIVFQATVVSIIYFISQLLYMKYGENDNRVVNLLGKWKGTVPVSGVAFYIITPPTLADLARDPNHVTVYACLLLMGCGLVSAWWFRVRIYSRAYVARLLGKQIPITRAQPGSISLNRWKCHVEATAHLVGFCVAALTLIAGFIGVPGSGTGIMLVVTVVCSYFERRTGDQARDVFCL